MPFKGYKCSRCGGEAPCPTHTGGEGQSRNAAEQAIFLNMEDPDEEEPQQGTGNDN